VTERRLKPQQQRVLCALPNLLLLFDYCQLLLGAQLLLEQMV
jgi:hypothetical protein